MALTKLTKNLIDGTFGTEWVSTIQTSNFTAEAAKGYFVNTTAGTITINLPAGVVGTEIVIQDYAGTFATNKVLLNANGSEKIQGSALEGQITTNNATAVLIYQDATKQLPPGIPCHILNRKRLPTAPQTHPKKDANQTKIQIIRSRLDDDFYLFEIQFLFNLAAKRKPS